MAGEELVFGMAMDRAAVKGHLELVLEMIKHGSTDFDDAMSGAAHGGYPEIVQEMIDRGAA